VVGHNVCHLLKPPCCHLTQNLSFEGDSAPVDVEGGLTVGCYEESAAEIRLSVDVPDFALVPLPETGKIGLLQSGLEEWLEFLWSDHVRILARRRLCVEFIFFIATSSIATCLNFDFLDERMTMIF